MPLRDKVLFRVVIYCSNHFPDYSNFWIEHTCVKCMNGYKADVAIGEMVLLLTCVDLYNCAQFGGGDPGSFDIQFQTLASTIWTQSVSLPCQWQEQKHRERVPKRKLLSEHPLHLGAGGGGGYDFYIFTFLVIYVFLPDQKHRIQQPHLLWRPGEWVGGQYRGFLQRDSRHSWERVCCGA